MTSLNPVHKIGAQIIEGILLHKDVSRKEARNRAARGAEGGRDPARRAPDRRLSAPVLRRYATARDDRDGPRQRALAADRRRADDSARRDDAGTDPRADAQAAERLRHRDHHDHPRPRRRGGDRRRGRRHVRSPRRREGAGERALRAPAASLHLGLARVAAAPRIGHRQARPDSRNAAVAALAATRLPVQPALPVRLRPLQEGAPGARPFAEPSRSLAGLLPG